MFTVMATRLLGRLRIWQKIALIGLVFTFPLALTMYYLLEEKNYKIDFAQSELHGDEYLRPVTDLLASVLSHDSLSRRQAAGDATVQADLARVEARIAAELKELTAVDGRLSPLLHTDARQMKDLGRGSSTPIAIHETWDRIAAGADRKSDDASHAKLVADIRTLITHVGDSSKLILDPDLDTYYTMDALLLKEPEILDRVGKLGDEVTAILKRKTIAVDEREDLAGAVTPLRSAIDGLTQDMETAVAETANFSRHARLRGAAMPMVGEVVSNMRALLDLTVAKAIRPQVIDYDPADYVKAVQATAEASTRLWQVLLDEEDQMLQIRMDGDLRRRATALIATALAVLLSILVAFLVLQTVTGPVRQAVEITNQIARGEIPDKFEWTHSNDEMGVLLTSVQSMLQFLDLKTTMRTLQNSAAMLTEAQNDMERHSTEAEQQITRQAAALHETQATAQEIKQTSQLASQKAEAVLKVAEMADTVGRTGESAIEHSLGGLTDIRAQFQEVARCIRELNERTSQIGGITQTVKDLADQSNMLALNAAIEAVRSGEHGKGFAVVAREIRSLADQSIQATNRVHDILDGTNQAIRTAVSITETGGQRMEGGLLQVKESGESLHELSKIVRDSSQGVRQIAAAVSQQNAGISQIFTAVIDQNKMMDETVQRLNATREAAKLVKGACQQVAAVSMRFHL